ncbi:MAG: flippase [Nitrospira sp.]|nr:flippase [Nitrospira sp.]
MAIDLGIGIPRIDIASGQLASDQALVRIAGGSALFFVGTFIGLGLNYAYTIMLARLLGPEQFGLYAIGLGCFNLLSVIALAGLDTAVLRFVPALRAQRDAAGIRGIIRVALVLSSGLGVLFAAVLLLSSDMLAEQFLHNPDASKVLQLFALSIPLLVVSTVTIAALQAFGEVRWRTFVKYLCEPIVKFAVTLGFIWIGWGLMSAVLALPIALLLTVGLALIPIRLFWLKAKDPIFPKKYYSEIVTYSLPLFGGIFLNSIATRSDVFFLGYWASVADVGIYSAAFQTAAIMALVLGTLESVATPFLSESISKNDRTDIRLLAGTVLRWTMMVTLPLCIVMTVFATDVMDLFGNEFASGWICLVILTVGQFANSATGCSNGMLLWSGHSKLVMWNSVVASGTQIALYLILIPSYGIVGAAIAASASLVLTTVLRIAQVHHVLNIWPYDFTIIKPLASGLLSLVLILMVRAILPATMAGVLVGLFAITYLALLLMFGLPDGDRTMLLHLRRRFVQSI